MSGSGMIPRARALRLSPEAAVELDRGEAAAHVRGKLAFLREGSNRHRVEGVDLDHLTRVLEELAVELERGDHARRA